MIRKVWKPLAAAFVLAILFTGCFNAIGNLLPNTIFPVKTDDNWIFAGTGSVTKSETFTFTAEQLSKLRYISAQVGGSSTLKMTQAATSQSKTITFSAIGVDQSIDTPGFIPDSPIVMTVTINKMTAGSITIMWD